MAKKHSEQVKNAVLYQINLRAYTPEGTLRAAAAHLNEAAATGADVVYLCPFVEADNDPDPANWSPRQHKSCCMNSRNPYRQKDYFKVDPEYGCDEDLLFFVETAHKLGLKVMFDLVYLHAGPSFGKAHPDFVQKNGDGSLKCNEYNFLLIDFSNPDTREYLWGNMEYFVRKFDIDGYRCDVGFEIPLDFWVEGARRVRKIKPGFLMLNEGAVSFRKEDQDEAFDINYLFHWDWNMRDFFLTGMPVDSLRRAWHDAHDADPDAVNLMIVENHDTANDSYNRRPGTAGKDKYDAALALCFAIDGVPMLYNGCEYCDCARHSIFARKGTLFVDRSGDPSERSAFLRDLAALHRTENALRDGKTIWIDHPFKEDILIFKRDCGSEKILFAVNLGNTGHTVCLPELAAFSGGKELLMQRCRWEENALDLEANGFAMVKISAC